MPFLALAYTLNQISPPGHPGRLNAAIAIATIEPQLDAATLEACKQRADKCVETRLLAATFHCSQPYARCMRVKAESDIPK